MARLLHRVASYSHCCLFIKCDSSQSRRDMNSVDMMSSTQLLPCPVKQWSSRHTYLGAMSPAKSRHQVASAESDSGVPYGEGVSSPTVVSSPSEIRDRALSWNVFWHILKVTERSFLHLYADGLSLSNSVSCQIWGKADVWGQLLPAPT